ncbi:MAG: metal-dependent transcriptional regulator [Patescibacteria group bacterium]
MNQKQEDYLITMYRLYEKNKQIRSVDVAKQLKISKASVSEMLKKFKKQKIINMNLYSNIIFTSKGLNVAKKLAYKHRVVEVFLKKVLKCKSKNIHTEAHRLEHAFSDQAIKKLAKFLNNPKVCPDGDKIPKI